MIGAKELRDSWIRFFTGKGFVDVSDRSVIPPASDKSLLFINSGVAAIKSYFCGDSSLPSRRMCSAQRVIRTGDIDSIGKSFRHHTYFEMLGNFSVGNVSRREAIDLAWEFLTEVLGMDEDLLYVTVFEEDEESYGVWKSHIPEERIVRCGKGTNFWDMGVGPCGPCTEIYFDRGEEYDEERRGVELLRNDVENRRFLEIWNLVFSDYLNIDGKIMSSPTKNLDTGAGLERLLAVLQGKDNCFSTSLFTPIIGYLRESVGEENEGVLWAPADYLRTTCVLIRDGVEFGNKGREYVLRKIFRKACSALPEGKLNRRFFEGAVDVITSTLDYYDWSGVRERIVGKVWDEYRLIVRNKEMSDGLLEKLFRKYEDVIPAEEIFDLVTRDGLSYVHLEHEICEKGRRFSVEEYQKLFEEHKSKSFNENISSAFAKQIPALVEKATPTVFDYENEEIESRVSCVYVGEEFRKFDGSVGEGESVYVVLEKTNVFPMAAGQDSDEGSFYLPDGKGGWEWVKIEASIKAANGQILHRFTGLGEEAIGRITSSENIRVLHDAKRRRRLEMNHTAEHLVYAVLKGVVSGEISRISGNKREDGFSIEVMAPVGTRKEDFDLVRINGELNGAIRKGVEVVTEMGSLERAKEMGIVGKFEEIYEMNRDNLRFVCIGEYGAELCIGTHVRNTKEIEEALIVKFVKEKKDAYKFYGVTGRENVEKVLGGKSMEDFLVGIQNKELIDRQRKMEEHAIFMERKKELVEELLGCEGKVKVLEKEVEHAVAMGAFKEIRGFLKDGDVVLLFFREGEAYRFFVASRGVDIGGAFGILRDMGAKCGGNNSFGSGMYYGKDFKETFIRIIS